ncbi:MAG: carboxymuconolactone decarboxylase family protein [Verrucomicrobiales bacterium]
MQFTQHTKETAPEASVPILEGVEQTYGFIPNIYDIMAESPAAITAYTQITKILQDHAALSPQEQQIVMIAISEDNGCGYCVAAHSMVAGMAEVPEETVAALREGRPPEDSKQAALVAFAKSVLDHRGWVPEEDRQAFLDAGYTTRHALDVITVLALKTLSNFTNHLADTPLDEAFAEHAV